MENNTAINNSGMTTEKSSMMYSGMGKNSSEISTSGNVMNNLIAEGGENFVNYISRLGFVNDQNVLVLSSNHHYYYDDSELQSVTTLINLKKLNLIKHLDNFMTTLCSVMSPKTDFIGCFSDKKNQKDESLYSKFSKGLINFLDSKTDKSIDRKDVYRLLELQGHKIVDMTEINGLTYFKAQYNG